jgi:hypothetical protein
LTLARSRPFRIAAGNDLTPSSRARYSPCLSHGCVDKSFKGSCKRPCTPTHPLLWGSTGIYHMQCPVLIVSPSPPLSISTLDGKRQFEYHHMGRLMHWDLPHTTSSVNVMHIKIMFVTFLDQRSIHLITILKS